MGATASRSSARRTVVAALGLALLALCACSRGPEPRPNILLIAIDTLRADHTSLCGYERETTPCLDAFARTATVFERAHSPSSWTRASFASYFTGLRPSVHGCEGRDDALSDDHRTLAECFRDAGWATAAVYSNANITAELGFDQGFDIYDHPEPNAGYRQDFKFTDATAVNARALSWLRDERPADVPWFMFVHYIDPHDPYMPHEEYVFGSNANPGVRGSRKYLRRIASMEPLVDRDGDKQVIRDLYDGEVAFVDAHVGILLDELDAADLAEDTIVIVCSDHGEGLWDHEDYRGHGKQLYQEQIHVPLAVRWPGRTEPGRRVSAPVNVTDVFATLAGEFGLAEQGSYQGRSLLARAEAGAAAEPVFVIERLDEVRLRSLVDWPWKLILDDSGRTARLYHLEQDPGETASLADARPDRLGELILRLDAIAAADSLRRSELDIAVKKVERSKLGKKQIRDLRALGYVH